MRIHTRRSYRGYGEDAGQAVANILAQASPWNAIISGFTAGQQSSQDKAAIASMQAQQAMAKSASAAQITKYVAMGAAAFIGGLIVISTLKKKS